MSTTPAVSILMPVRDAAATLDACLDSIRAQTFGDYELLVLDDASGDASGEIVAARARADARIRLPAPHGRGLVACLNAGLAAARAPLVARMDADDLMDRERIALQRKYLSEHPHVDLVASRVRAFPPEQVRAGMREYLRWQNACLAGDALREEIYVESPFAHASVMYRRDAVRAAGGYRDGDFPEDYELWLRLERIGCRMAKIDRCLLDWRQHDESLSRRDPRYSRDAFDRLRARYLLEDPRLAQGRPLVLWGAGRRTRRRARHFLAGGIVPAAWIDVDPRKLGHCINGVPVVGPEWLEAQRPRPFVLTWVARHGARERIAAALDAMGYARGVDYLAVG